MKHLCLLLLGLVLVQGGPMDRGGMEHGGMGDDGWGDGMMGGGMMGGGMMEDKQHMKWGAMLGKAEKLMDMMEKGWKKEKKSYVFAFDVDWKPYTFLDAITGYPIGFLWDIVHAACKMADKKCETVIMPWKECYDMATRKSEALNVGYVDACVGWSWTYPLWYAYDVTGVMAPDLDVGFFVPTTSSITAYDPNTHKVAFDWYDPRGCTGLKKVDKLATKDELMFHTEKAVDMKAALTNNQVDVLFIEPSVVTGMGWTDLKQIGTSVKCGASGLGFMVRRGRKEEFEWFNEQVEKMKKDHAYGWLCNIARKAYDGAANGLVCEEKEKPGH